MVNTGAIRSKLANSSDPTSFAARARRRRWDALLAEFPDLPEMDVVDLGGTPASWADAPVGPRSLVLVNLTPVDTAAVAEGVEHVTADACDLPHDLLDRSFDLVYSNSVIEHVGGHWRRERFAANVRALAPHHWVQTPYRYFPIEPHFLFPLFQHLPLRFRGEILRRWPLAWGYAAGKGRAQAEADAMTVELLSRAEMEAYFSESRLLEERIGPLLKSITAVR